MFSKGSDQIRLCVCACWSEPLLVAHTTLLEISFRGSYMDLLAALREMVRPAITDLFCFGTKSTGVNLFANKILTPSIKKLSVITLSKQA